MAAEYMHIGIPVLNRKPGMVYNEWGKFWVNESVDEYDYKIEYLKFEEGTRFPELLSKQPHVAYKVDDAEPYLAEADRVIFGPEALGENVRLAFIVKDDAIIAVGRNCMARAALCAIISDDFSDGRGAKWSSGARRSCRACS